MLRELPLKAVKLNDQFWSKYQTLIKEKTIPYQYQVMNDELAISIEKERDDPNIPSEKSHAIENFRIAAGLAEGHHYGWLFQDSDVYKWLEAIGYQLQREPDLALEKLADQVIDLIWQAQDEDGYLSTYYQIEHPELKFCHLFESHELYCAGHLIEAAIAYQEGTSKTKLLEVAERFVRCIDQYFGYEDGKIQGADGHQEIELALFRLYEHNGNQQALNLAVFFLDIRGENPEFYQQQIDQSVAKGGLETRPAVNLYYLQAYTQPKKQLTAEGHAVRLLYMATAMAGVSRITGDQELLTASKAIWADIYQKKMYITAGVGSTVHGEAFTAAYDLPTDTMYCETCASIALAYFAYELFKIEPKAEYLEVIERAFYNGILAGAANDGEHFFYVNPLEVTPEIVEGNPGQSHVKSQRPDWLGCACCPPNFARMISSIGKYLYSFDLENKALYLNIFTQSSLELEIGGGVKLIQETDFPLSNQVSLKLAGAPENMSLYLRKPTWLTAFQINCDYQEKDGFIILQKKWQLEEQLIIQFETPVISIQSHPLVLATTSRVAIQRGPFIYCSESIDNEGNLFSYRLGLTDFSVAKVSAGKDSLSQVMLISLLASKQIETGEWQDQLYRTNWQANYQKINLNLIPYFLWGNRGISQMLLWHYLKE